MKICRRKVQNEGGNADEADFPELLGITLRAWRAWDYFATNSIKIFW